MELFLFSKFTWTKKTFVFSIIFLLILLFFTCNSRIFNTSRKINFQKIQSFDYPETEIKVEEIQLIDPENLNKKYTKVQVVPLWPSNDSLKVKINKNIYFIPKIHLHLLLRILMIL